ncbi:MULTISPECIES: lipoprotein insertase outer membrane protein LolB [Stenotrophomonas]|uniref:lipoprotein insertase outer membrane protein LolB n=1 Tax=Stenotrophomonas TaxID=40323 RepID=UPI000770685E|nr:MULTISPECIES: lipoprotein insertase outer membrane protein LolB [Stenotrophomonas]AMJ57558.1 lipoprotein localization factor LolB [Stenotrophomonas sp. KCTC 12332]
MNVMMWRAPLALVMVGALAACGSVPKRQAAPVAAEVAQISAAAQAAEQARQAALMAQPDWSFQGRVAISKGRNGGNGRIDWLQQGPVYQVSLAAPVTRQSWQLSGGEPGQPVRLDGLEGGPRSADDAAQLLLQATGWEIPVAQLAQWVRGLPTSAGMAPEHLGFDADGRPRVLRQQGWQVDYLDWYPAEAGRPSLPRRIEAVNGDAKVRLIVDEWGAGAP